MTTTITNRINGAEKNETLKSLLPKPARKAAPKSKAKAKPAIKASAARIANLHRWAQGTVVGSVLLSAWLNGLSASAHAPQSWQGWLIGIAIPLLVLALGRVSTLSHAMGYRGAALGVGAAGCGLLALSVFHCAEALASLTGSHLGLALPMAIAIDCGLVACEAVALLTEEV